MTTFLGSHTLDADFDEIGYHLSDDSTPPSCVETLRCLDLWCNVIVQAFVDMDAKPSTNQFGSDFSIKELARQKANHWLLQDARDFVFICELASVNPHVIRGAAKQVRQGSRVINYKVQKADGEYD